MGGKCAKENNNYKTVTKEPCTFLNEGAMLFRKFFEFVKKYFVNYTGIFEANIM